MPVDCRGCQSDIRGLDSACRGSDINSRGRESDCRLRESNSKGCESACTVEADGAFEDLEIGRGGRASACIQSL